MTSSSVASGTSVTTTSPSSLSTGASVASIDSPPHSCSSQNSSGPSQPRTPARTVESLITDMSEVFTIKDLSLEVVKKLYDAESKPVEFSKTERVDAAVVRKKSANYKRKERDLVRKKSAFYKHKDSFP